MLSPRPEERGGADELAEALARGVAHAPPSADAPLFEWETQKPSEWTQEERAAAEQLGHRPRRRDRQRARRAEQAEAAERAEVERREVEARTQATALARQVKVRRWLPWLAAAMALGLWPEETGFVRTEQPLTGERGAQRGAVSLGDTARSSSVERAKTPGEGVIAQELPTQPLPRQLQPDAKGQCPKGLIAINGGCWAKVGVELKDCLGNGFVYRGGCYVPFFATAREPTSAPRER
jgi:hypothetical protein